MWQIYPELDWLGQGMFQNVSQCFQDISQTGLFLRTCYSPVKILYEPVPNLRYNKSNAMHQSFCKNFDTLVQENTYLSPHLIILKIDVESLIRKYVVISNQCNRDG